MSSSLKLNCSQDLSVADYIADFLFERVEPPEHVTPLFHRRGIARMGVVGSCEDRCDVQDSAGGCWSGGSSIGCKAGLGSLRSVEKCI